MSKVDIELNEKGVQELLKSPEMQEILERYGAQKSMQAGNGYSFEVHEYQKRAVCNIYPDTREAALDNYENNTLLKVIG